MFFNAKIAIIGIITGVLVLGGAGYFFVAKIGTKDVSESKESITRVTGGPAGRVEAIGRSGDEGWEKTTPSSVELKKGPEQARFYGYGAPEPEELKLSKTEEGPGFKLENPSGKEGASEIKVLPGPRITSAPAVSKPSLLAPNQYSSREEFKKEAEKYYTDSYIKTLDLTQDAMVRAGFLKEGDRSSLKNENDIRSYWVNFTKFLIANSDLSSLAPEQREKATKAEVNLITVEPDFAGYQGGGSILPVASSIADSLNNRLEFAENRNFTEEQLVEHFYPEFYLNQLSRSQEEMIRNGFIKPEERVFLKTRKEVEWLILKEIDYLKSKGVISQKEGEDTKKGIINSLSGIQQSELDTLNRYFGSRSSFENKNEQGILANIDFSLRFGNLLGAFWGMFKTEIAQAATEGPFEMIDMCATDGGFSIFTFYTPNLQLGIGAETIGGPIVVDVFEDCWRSIMYDAAPYGPEDWRTAIWWEDVRDWAKWAPGTKPPRCEGPNCIPPGLPVISPGWFFPTRCCSCARFDTCQIIDPPIIVTYEKVTPWGCHVFCQLNLIWDDVVPNICSCGP